MNDEPVGADTLPEGEEEWALVEVFGHRKHYGRVREVERFGAKMLRVDVPSLAAAPLLGEEEKFETFFYGGSSIFSFTPMTEEAARKWAESNRPRPMTPLNRLPPPEEEWRAREDEWQDHEEERPF